MLCVQGIVESADVVIPNTLFLFSIGDGMNAYVAYKVSTQVCLTPLCLILHYFSMLKGSWTVCP